MAVKDWRRAARHTALAGLLARSLGFTWPQATSSLSEDEHLPSMPQPWEGLFGAGAA
jgi:hypothetical protein